MFLRSKCSIMRQWLKIEICLIVLLMSAALLFNLSLNDNTAKELPVSSGHSIDGIPLQAKAACLYDCSKDSFLYEAASDQKLAPASTVKLMTALIAADICGFEELVTVGKEINKVPPDSSRAWLQEGEILSVRQLLYAMLLPSGNDAAYSLAVFCGRKLGGSAELSIEHAIDLFLLQMNEKAAALGAYNTFFLTPDGYDKNGQYSSAYDLALIAAEFCRNQALLAIVGCFESSEQWLSGREAIYYNTNDLLNPDSPFFTENALGLKTGTSSNAGACLVAAKEIDGEIYIAVVLGSREDDRYRDCLMLFEHAEQKS